MQSLGPEYYSISGALIVFCAIAPISQEMFGNFSLVRAQKGVFWKRGLLRKVHISRDSRESRDSRDSREPPDCGKQRRIRPFSRDSREFRDLEIRQNGFFADFYFWAAGFFRGFCRRIFSPHFCGKKCPEKSSRKIPGKILQNLYNKNPRHLLYWTPMNPSAGVLLQDTWSMGSDL